MRKFVKAFLLTSALSTALWAIPAHAVDTSAGKEVTAPEATRSTGEAAPRKGGPRNVTRSGGASRAPGLDDAKATKSFTIVTRSKDGKETRTAPGEDLLRALKGEKKAEADTAAPKGAADPANAEESRAIVGNDNRVAISNATKYPFSAAGFLDASDAKSGTGWGCTATMVAPSTILTAASCVYSHEIEGGWLEDTVFFPAINGEDKIPYGSFSWKNMSVLEGFITDYDGTYDSIWPYDVAMIELDTPVGDQMTGWLGYGYYPDLGDFEANVLSYNDDVPAWTLSRSTCQILTENVSDYDFLHDCDTDNNWAFGAPVYFFDPADKTRRIIGINMGGEEMNWALRINDAVFAWMIEVAK